MTSSVKTVNPFKAREKWSGNNEGENNETHVPVDNCKAIKLNQQQRTFCKEYFQKMIF